MHLHSAAAREAWAAENVGPVGIDFTEERGWYVQYTHPVIMADAEGLKRLGLGWMVRPDGGLDLGEYQYRRLWEIGEFGSAVYQLEQQPTS
jgi:hypothetical protein